LSKKKRNTKANKKNANRKHARPEVGWPFGRIILGVGIFLFVIILGYFGYNYVNGNKSVPATRSLTENLTASSTNGVKVAVPNDTGKEASPGKPLAASEGPLPDNTFLQPVQLRLTIPSSAIVKETRTVLTLYTQIVQCAVQNENPNQLTFKWTAPIGKIRGDNLGGGKATRVAWDAPGTPGLYTVSVEVTDNLGQKARGQVDFNVEAGD
jgi:hypothetical protein